MNHDDKSTLRVELSEAKAWAAWFAAERDWERRRSAMEWLAIDTQSHENWEARKAIADVLARVRQLHKPKPDVEWNRICIHCSNFGVENNGEPWPCETIRILDGTEG